jgi:hypothetical protein
VRGSKLVHDEDPLPIPGVRDLTIREFAGGAVRTVLRQLDRDAARRRSSLRRGQTSCSNEKSLRMTVLDSLVRGAHCLSIDTGTDSASSLEVVGEVALVVVAGPASYLSYRQVGGP